MTPRRRKALEALVARGATPGEREAARQVLADATAKARVAVPPTVGSGFFVGGVSFKIALIDGAVTFDDEDPAP